jgi:hypothetical protein
MFLPRIFRHGFFSPRIFFATDFFATDEHGFPRINAEGGGYFALPGNGDYVARAFQPEICYLRFCIADDR